MRISPVHFGHVSGSNHFDKFQAIYEERFTKSHGFYRQVVPDVVHAYLKFGNLKERFACIRCPDCHYEYLLAFSCSGRWSRSLVPRLPVLHAIRRKLCSFVKYYGKIFFILFHTVNMFSAFQLSTI